MMTLVRRNLEFFVFFVSQSGWAWLTYPLECGRACPWVGGDEDGVVRHGVDVLVVVVVLATGSFLSSKPLKPEMESLSV